MPSVGKSRKDKWRKAAVSDVVDAHMTAVAVSRLDAAQDKGNLFTLDSAGKLNRKQTKRIARETKVDPRRPIDIQKEQNWVTERKKALVSAQQEKKQKRKTFDLWAEKSDGTPKKVKYARATKLFTEVPAVIIAESGQSVNPTDKSWKDTLLAAAAKADVEKERYEVIFDALRPVTAELHDIFPAEIVDTLTDDEQIRLFRIARDSRELLEEPEDFLARVLPTLTSTVKTNDAETFVKTEPETVIEIPVNKQDEPMSKGVLGKTTKERNRETRRKIHDAEVELHKQKKAVNKDFASLAECLQSIVDEREQISIRMKYREALVAYWKEARVRGEGVRFKTGSKLFKEPVGDVVTSDLRATQEGSLRKIPAPAHNSALRDRFASFQRRGMVEVATQLSSETFRVHKSRFNLEKNRKIRKAQKSACVTADAAEQ